MTLTKVALTDDTRDRVVAEAREWATDLGSLRGSIEDGEGNVAGRVGELVFTEVFGGEICDHYEYDIRYNGLTVDVKTKRRTVPPQPRYEASLADWNTEQDCDIYYFMSLLGEDAASPFSACWLCGYCTPAAYKDAATFHEKGDRDPDNGFVFSADCYNVPYSWMNRDETLPKQLSI